MSLAQSWEAAHPVVPPEITATLESSGDHALSGLELLLAIPEYEVELPGGTRPSQTDVLALMRGTSGLVIVAVEGKVDETFGPTVGEKRAEASVGVDARLAWLLEQLALSDVSAEIRYQLLHRTVSALVIGRQFDAAVAVMLVHSFSPTGKWFEDFDAFCHLFGTEARVGTAVHLGEFEGMPLFVGWCKGDQRFRERV